VLNNNIRYIDFTYDISYVIIVYKDKLNLTILCPEMMEIKPGNKNYGGNI